MTLPSYHCHDLTRQVDCQLDFRCYLVEDKVSS